MTGDGLQTTQRTPFIRADILLKWQHPLRPVTPPAMSVSPNTVTLTKSIKYGDAKRVIAAAWSRLAIIIYRPTLEHYKEGRPGAEELELGPE